MRIAVLILTAAFLLGAGSAQADDKLDCDKPFTQNDMNQCAEKEYKAMDSVLNVTYRALMAQIDKKAQDKLKGAQREWIKFRDADCEYQAIHNEGGSIWPLVYHGCLTEKTRARIKELSEPR